MNEPNTSETSDLDNALDRLEQKVNREEKSSGSGVSAAVAAFVMSFIALGAAAYSVYVSYLQQQASGSLDARLPTLEQPIRRAEQDLAELKQTIDSLQTTQSKQAGLFQQQLNEIVYEVQSIGGTSGRDWLLAEVEYLLKLANQRVLIEKDVDTAIDLLVTADGILEESEGIAAFRIREAIANDLAKLQAVGGIDMDGLFLKLGALVNQVDQLQQKRMSYQPPDEIIEETTAADELHEGGVAWIDSVKRFFARLYARLSGLVDFRRDARPVTPILPPGEEYYLRQNLILRLEQAQMALIKGTQTVFEYSLSESLEWVELYFEPTDPVTQSMSATLQELLQVRVERELPDISASLIQIRQLMADFHKSPNRAAQEPAAEENQ